MKTNVAIPDIQRFTHEGATAQRISKYKELRRSVLTCMLFENTFYESGSDIAARIAGLVAEVEPAMVASLAIEARDKMQLRHVPLFLIRELARRKGNGALVETTLAHVIQRADELAEYCALYWKEKRQPLSAGSKRGLALAFQKFDEYRMAKYNRDAAVKLRDVLFLCHAKPKDAEQDALWKRLIAGTLETPDTWETSLSGGADKKATFERLMAEGKLGGMACLKNLRNMQESGVDESLIRSRLSEGIKRALPFRFVVAAKYAPTIEDAIEAAMLQGVQGLASLPGKTGLLIDISVSMDYRLGSHGESSMVFQSQHVVATLETSRIDVAAGLAILLREKAESVRIATFSTDIAIVPSRRGFALRDAIKNSQPHSATHLKAALEKLRQPWADIDRLIVITDEQSQDGITEGWAAKSYLINVAPYKNGIGYGNGWTNISGWSERVVDYIAEIETEAK